MRAPPPGSLRSLLARLALKAIAAGARPPSSASLAKFAQQATLARVLKALAINVFLDVGANKGLYARNLRLAGYRGRLISFEPIPEDCARIRALAEGDSEWIVRCHALGASYETRLFHLNVRQGDETVLSSFLPFTGGDVASRAIPVQVHRLDEVLPELVADIAEPRIFLKMDTQGFDREVVAGAQGCLPRILGLQSEVSVAPIYAGMPHYTESLAAYEALGFELRDLFVVNRTASGGVLEYDCLMTRASPAR